MPGERTSSQAGLSWLSVLSSCSKYISTYSVKCREANLLLFLPLIWTSSVANVTSRRHLKSCVKYPDRDVLGKSAEDGQSQVVPRLDGGVAERFSGRRRWRERLGVWTERSTARGVVGRGELPTVIDVEIFVKLGHSWAHVWLGAGVIGATKVERVSSSAGVCSPEHRQLLDSPGCLLLRGGLSWSVPHLVQSVDKMTSWSVRTEADTVVGATQVCLVFRVSRHCAKFLSAVSKLAFLSIFAGSVLLEGTTHLGLVSGSVLDRRGDGGTGTSLALTSVQLRPAGSHWAIPVKAGQGISQRGGGRPQGEAKWLSLTLVNLNPQTLETVLSDLKVWERKLIEFPKHDSKIVHLSRVYFSRKRRKNVWAFFLTWLVTPAPSIQCKNWRDSQWLWRWSEVYVASKTSPSLYSIVTLLGRGGRKAEEKLLATVTFLLTEMWPFKAAWLRQL